jgi:hypothetical protein
MQRFALALPLCLAMFACTPGPADIGSHNRATTVTPDPSQVHIRSINEAGTGCPAGSVASNLAPDVTDVQFEFDSFVAQVGASLLDQRKSCQITIDLAVPAGFTYAVDRVIAHGSVVLDGQDARAKLGTMVYFQGQQAEQIESSTFTGPASRDYETAFQEAVSSLVFSPCGAERALNLKLQLAVTGKQALATLDEIEPIHLTWQRCL